MKHDDVQIKIDSTGLYITEFVLVEKVEETTLTVSQPSGLTGINTTIEVSDSIGQSFLGSTLAIHHSLKESNQKAYNNLIFIITIYIVSNGLFFFLNSIYPLWD